MATTDRLISYWQQGVNDARKGVTLAIYDSQAAYMNWRQRQGYANGYRYGKANPKNNENSK